MPKNPFDTIFPPADETDEFGIVAMGGDLSAERLLIAYSSGIFPWPHEGMPLLWFCPDPRFVMKPQAIIINHSLKKAIKHNTLTITADTCFSAVIKQCAQANRKDQAGTWINDDMIAAYETLHRLGYAHSIEAFDGPHLVGGLYGIALGKIFFGESMFFNQSNASKIGFVTLVAHLLAWDFSLIDCQAKTEHLQRFGAHEMERNDFLSLIAHNQRIPTKTGPWHFHLTPQAALALILKRA